MHIKAVEHSLTQNTITCWTAVQGAYILINVVLTSITLSIKHSQLLAGFVPFFRNKFPGLFQDFSRTQIAFSRALKFTLTSTIPRSQCQFSLLPSIQFIFLAAFHRFPGLSRTSGLFPGLSSPGKCHNEIPGLSRFSRTRTNPVLGVLGVISLNENCTLN